MTENILDYLKNLKENFIPKMKIAQSEIVFKEIRYGDVQSVEMDIENEGDGLLEFTIERLEDE